MAEELICVMAYLLFLFIVCLYYSLQKRNFSSAKDVIIISIPVIIIWVLFVGGQYGVGTDYFSYLSYFTHDDLSYFIDRGDIGFANFVKVCRNLGIEGQGVFFLLSFIWILLLLATFYYLLESKNLFIGLFFFVFIVFSTAFNNQMNGIRQYTSIYLLTCSLCLFFRKNYLIAALFALCAVLNHKSALIIVLIFAFFYFLKSEWFKNRWLYYIVVAGFICSLVLNVTKIFPFMEYLQGEEMLNDYTIYYNNIELSGADFSEKVTKYIYIPLYFLSVFKLDSMRLNETERKMFIIGIFSYSIKLAILSLPYIYRLGSYLEVLMCVPLVYLLIYYARQKSKLIYILLLLYLLVPYLMKVTLFAKAEYLYDSYFFH